MCLNFALVSNTGFLLCPWKLRFSSIWAYYCQLLQLSAHHIDGGLLGNGFLLQHSTCNPSYARIYEYFYSNVWGIPWLKRHYSYIQIVYNCLYHSYHCNKFVVVRWNIVLNYVVKSKVKNISNKNKNHVSQ